MSSISPAVQKVGHCIWNVSNFSDHFARTVLLPRFFFTQMVQALNKLEGSLDAGQSYEGHELFKTVFHRFRSRRQIADSYALAEVSLLP